MDFRTMLKKKKYAKNVADDDGPDWGNLKHVDRPEGEGEEADKKVLNDSKIHVLYKILKLFPSKIIFEFSFQNTDNEKKFYVGCCMARFKTSQDVAQGKYTRVFTNINKQLSFVYI